MIALLVVVALIAGVAPELHGHDSAYRTGCHDAGHPPTTHFETSDLDKHGPCGLCARSLYSVGLESSLLAYTGELVKEATPEEPELWLQSPPGRHGACRAPPRS